MFWIRGQTAHTGNTLAEHGFLIALVAIASLAGLGTLGLAIQNQFGQLFVTGASTSTFDPANPAASISVADLAHPLAQGTVTLSPNEAAALQQSTDSLVQTVGANGTTLLASKQIAATAQQLLDQQKITPAQYNLLMDLANQGHYIASIESLVEDAYSSAVSNKTDFSSSTVFDSARLPLNGQSYTPYELSALVGFDGSLRDNAIPNNLLNATSVAQPEMAKFLVLYQQVNEQGLLQDPAIKSIVDNASMKIAQAGEWMEDTLYYGDLDMDNGDNSSLKEKIASNISNTNASIICNTQATNIDNKCQ